MPRTKGCSCWAAQIGSASSRSSSVKAIGERIPVQKLISLQQPGCTASARGLPGRDEGEGAFLEVLRRLGEEVEERNRVVPVCGPERVAHASATAAPGLEVREEGERDVRRRAVQRKPGDVGRISLTAGKRLILAAEPDGGCEPLEQPQRLGLPCGHLSEEITRWRLREALRQVFEAVPVAGDDRPLLAREGTQRLRRHPPGLELGEVSMIAQATLDRRELGPYAGEKLNGVHVGIFNR